MDQLVEAKSDENKQKLRVGSLTRPGPVDMWISKMNTQIDISSSLLSVGELGCSAVPQTTQSATGGFDQTKQ